LDTRIQRPRVLKEGSSVTCKTFPSAIGKYFPQTQKQINQDFNKLLDPKNNDFKTVDDFLKKYPDLSTRFTELGLYTVPKKPEVNTNNDDNNNTNTNQNVKKPNETQSTSTLQGVDSMQGV
jgi:hypothetical protein